MKIIRMLGIAVLALLSIAAGLAKVMRTPQEVEFLQGAGLSIAAIIVFGLVQVSGGILLAPRKTRLPGAVLAAAAFVLSAVLIFMGDNLAFGLVSLLPIALAGVVIYQSVKTRRE